MKRILFFCFTLLLQSCSHQQEAPQDGCCHTARMQKTPWTIVVDAGHGGENLGTRSSSSKHVEKDLTLATSQQLVKHLQSMGYRVVLTRKSDKFIPLVERAQIANKIEGDLFISVHYNAAPKNPKANGIEVYYHDDRPSQLRSNYSKMLAENVHRSLLSSTKAADRGVREAAFIVIKDTQMPAILIEGGFMTNSEEMKKLANPDYINKIAYGIARGLDQYVAEVEAKRI